jgi:hypothetical protein
LDLTGSFYEGIAALGVNPERLRRYHALLFRNVDPAGKTLLDVGAGSGLMGFYPALGGAEVTCLEPEAAGSSSMTARDFQTLRDSAPDDISIRYLAEAIEDHRPEKPYDIVLVHDAINHLDEGAVQTLHTNDPVALDRYDEHFARLAGLTAPGGMLIVADCSRHNLWAALHLRNPFAPSIEWYKHQPPGLWERLLARHGFDVVDLVWDAPRRFGAVGQALLGNRAGAYVLISHFILTLRREGRSASSLVQRSEPVDRGL